MYVCVCAAPAGSALRAGNVGLHTMFNPYMNYIYLVYGLNISSYVLFMDVVCIKVCAEF